MSKTAPLVSIIISCYNAGRWLRASLDSAISQTHPALEILVVDDGSTDDSPAILADYATRHPGKLRVITQENRGQSPAFNRAIAESRGAYVKLLDADDLLSPEAVAVQVEALAGASPLRLAHGAWSRFYSDPSEARFTPRPGWRDSDDPVDWLCETWADGQPMYQCALFLIPRVLLDRAGPYDERLSLINDFEFFTRLVLASEGIAYTPDARLFYRSGIPGSVSARKSRRAWESAFLSATLATGHLLAAEDSPRTRRAAAKCLCELVFSMYPSSPDLVKRLEGRIRELQPDGPPLAPGGGRLFRALSSVLGWKAARRAQLLLSR